MKRLIFAGAAIAALLLSSGAWAEPPAHVMVGKEGKFAMTLPDGYKYDALNYWYASPDGKVHFSPRDTSFFSDADYFDEALKEVPGEAKTQQLGKSTLLIKEEKEGFNGPSSLYFINFNGQFKNCTGCMIRFSNFEGLQGTQSPEVLKAVASVIRYTPFLDFPKTFDAHTTAAMSTFMNGGLYAADGSTVFGRAFDSNGIVAFVRLDLAAKGDAYVVKSHRVIEKGVAASYVSLYGDYAFYIHGGKGIYCVRKDGGNPRMVIEDAVKYLQVKGDTMYWCDAAYKLKKVDMTTLISVIEGKKNLDGEEINLQDNIAEVFDKEVYYPFMLNDEWLIYQDDADHESLHLRHLDTATDISVTNYPSNGPVVYGQDMYFCAKQGDVETLAKIDLSAPSAAFDENSDSFACGFSPAEFSGKEQPMQISIDTQGYCYAGIDQGRHVSKWKQIENAGKTLDVAYYFNGPEFDIYFSFKEGKVSRISVASKIGAIKALPVID